MDPDPALPYSLLGPPPHLLPPRPPPPLPSPHAPARARRYAPPSAWPRPLWLDWRAELLRASTPLSPGPAAHGVSWRVRKDITRYAALLRPRPRPRPRSPAADDDDDYDDAAAAAPATFTMALGSSNSTPLHGSYSVNLTLHFYRGAALKPPLRGLYGDRPADAVVPISNDAGGCSSAGYWFKVHDEADAKSVPVLIPKNAYRAVLEIFVSAHGGDENWYANPLRSTGPDRYRFSDAATATAKPNGAFRQVAVTVDRRFGGAVVPFPVIHPNSINPFFWAPVAAIGAYDHPSYDLDLTPILGLYLDGEEHTIGLTIKDSQPYWLISANLHLWLDPLSDRVVGGLIRLKVPPLRLSRQADWRELDGKSSIDGQVIMRFSGWVSSSKGNITTSIKHRLKFKSRVEVLRQGAIKEVNLDVKARTDVRTERKKGGTGRMSVSQEFPLYIETVSSSGGEGSAFERTKMFHGLTETVRMAKNKEVVCSILDDRQDAEGSVFMEDGVAKWGSGNTKSIYKYRDDKQCYLRTVNTAGGEVKDDTETTSCALVAYL
ncbi:peptide-N4-(N-acetyl-beta-glucosaminyl)asparagine amidase A-like [Ananas comosus]|uniref:Peptide-N4-(N-acetyl-beta- glucosaminyl)asparagine amidase A-like n=1 Tax=Ananas comosus TaxID=4615 RepID=A0A6P5HLT8_ANACO|nr:peptide-N4-(N-acetyl-beta-glucosaminyl)asparagine amidase A-like [Ananas comosus]